MILVAQIIQTYEALFIWRSLELSALTESPLLRSQTAFLPSPTAQDPLNNKPSKHVLRCKVEILLCEYVMEGEQSIQSEHVKEYCVPCPSPLMSAGPKRAATFMGKVSKT